MFNGDLAALIIYDRALTGSERAGVEEYLFNTFVNVPEPSALVLTAVGFMGIVSSLRRRTRK